MNRERQCAEREGAARLVQCIACRHFEYFPNRLGHNSAHSFGKCRGTAPWDGNLGQWPMFQHPCKVYEEADGAIPASAIPGLP